MGHKITLRRADGETETLARYPDHDNAKRHVADYCRWDDVDWEVADGYQSAECDDGRRLTITPAPIYTRYRSANVETDPRHGVLDWGSGIWSVDGLEVIPSSNSHPDEIDYALAAETLGLVLPDSDLKGYLAEHEREEVDPPAYYSRFPDKDRKPLLEGPEHDDFTGDFSTLSAGHVEIGIRILNGSGRYDASEFTLHDCLPVPCILSREGIGHVVLTPGFGSR